MLCFRVAITSRRTSFINNLSLEDCLFIIATTAALSEWKVTHLLAKSSENSSTAMTMGKNSLTVMWY